MSFYFNNVIENTTVIDKASNVCLKPLHGFMHTFGNNDTVKVFRISLPNQVDRIPSKQQSTIRKIVNFIIHFIFFIPGIIAGAILKGLAQLSTSVREKNAILREHLSNKNSPKKDPVLVSTTEPEPTPTPSISASTTILVPSSSRTSTLGLEPLPGRPKIVIDLTVTKEIELSKLNQFCIRYIMMNYLMPHEMAQLATVNKSFYKFLSKENSLYSLYDKIHRMPEDYKDSLLELSKLCKNRKMEELCSFHYNNPSLNTIFSMSEIMNMRCIVLSNERSDVHAAARSALNHEKTKNLSIFRIRYTDEKGKRKESIIVKFTLYVPTWDRDFNWKHYFLLEAVETARGIRWKFNNSIHNIDGYDIPIVGKNPNTIFNDITDDTVEAFTKLKKKRMLGWMEFRKCLGFSRSDARDSLAYRKIFRDVPFVLGHVDIHAFSFKEETSLTHDPVPTYIFEQNERLISDISIKIDEVHETISFKKLGLDPFEHVLGFLTPYELARLREVGRAFFKYFKYQFSPNLYRNEGEIKRRKEEEGKEKTEIAKFFESHHIYSGSSTDTSITSFSPYWKRCYQEAQNYIEKNQLLIKLFGSVKKIMSLPVFFRGIKRRIHDVITETSKNHDYSICRIRVPKRDWIVVKYTLFIPDRTTKVLHNYFLMTENRGHYGNEYWTIEHSDYFRPETDPNALVPIALENEGVIDPEAPDVRDPDLEATRFIENNDVDLWEKSTKAEYDLFSQLISGKVIGFFKDGRHLGFEGSRPLYMAGQDFALEQYSDLPVSLGHVPAEAFRFKQREGTNILDFEDTLVSVPAEHAGTRAEESVHPLSL